MAIPDTGKVGKALLATPSPLDRIAAALERIATALEDGKAGPAAPPEPTTKTVEPGR
jgi:hypothetical protein